ncbi:MAG TPA: SNF2-related protein [Verrucomicrobiae bacterium]|nr:SNF2-related protein [Verrucomicrobiae bacterium]
MSVELTDAFFAKIAGWEAMKRARAMVGTGHVLSSNWSPPVLKGVVQEGETSYRAGLVIKNSIDIDNLCTCRDSREWGTICAHSVAVGLHHLKPAPAPELQRVKPAAPRSGLARGTEGEPAELCIIFPPNFSQAASRGKVMLSFEGSWAGGRSPLNALPKNRAWQFSEQDNRLLDALDQITGGDVPAVLVLETKDLPPLLSMLVDHPRVTLGKSTPLKVVSRALASAATATLLASGEIEVVVQDSGGISIAEGWTFHNNTIQPSAGGKSGRIPRSQVPQFLNTEFRQLGARANFSLEDFTFEVRPPKFILELKGGLAQLSALLQCQYGPRILTLGTTSRDEAVWLPDSGDAKGYSTRDLAAEQAALGRLLRAGFNGPDAQGRYQLLGQSSVLNFFAREFPKLQREWHVTMEERLERSTTEKLERIEPRFQINPSGERWFDLDVAFNASGGEKFSPAEIQRLLLSGQSHTRLKNGKFAVIDTGAVEELQEVLLDCAPQQHPKGYRIDRAQAAFVQSSIGHWKLKAPAGWGELKMECPPLGELESVLRPYQKSGVAWLNFLRANGFGGILADEMGLGKTLQTLALVQGIEGTVLVICPTSLVFNWVAEAKKFTPQLKVIALNGPDRHELFEDIPNSNLVITSYALIRRDSELYREIEFDTVVLDEAQHIKNRETQNAQAVKNIRARHRLVLTGTPLENSVLDLWSIFDFLMPGYLGAAQDFRERYEIPITRHRAAHAQERLARRLRPFILRRLKRDVAPELPPKVEQVAMCDLSGEQSAVYQQILDASRKEVFEAVDTQGLARSRMVILNALLRLRQICCDLRLLKLENASADNSGKVELFTELLDEAIDGGHRVLVFSQFVSMLSLLKDKLKEREVEFCYLDGSTGNRGEVVNQFQQGNAPVFLISLKAGGVGLNLAGADTVVHFDPWWNPAVEDQATDRAHRIGQTRVVTSYKLITRNTVEEKILSLQQRKREIISATLGGEEQLAEALTLEELRELLQ